jgi:hypothetical protein
MHETAINSLATLAVLFALVLAPAVTAQKPSKPWTEFSRTEAEKLLNDSPWAQTQVDTDTSEMFFSPTNGGTASIARSAAPKGRISDQQSINNNRADRGATNQAVSVTYRICFLSARPIRQAFAKMILLSQHQRDDNLMAQLQAFVDRDFSPYIVIAVSVDSTDSRFSGPVLQAFNSAAKGTLKSRAYLERPDGKRLFIMDYLPPIPDGLGAKFIFPRIVNGEFFLTTQSESVRFVAEFSDKIKLDMRYKVADMIYEERLEY